MALPTHLQLQIVSADRSLVNETVDEVEIPGADGYFGVLPGHTPLLALLGAGELWYRQGQEKHYLAIGFGFAEVQPDRVTILAQIAEKADEIDIARAEAARKRAEERLAMLSGAVDLDAERARISLVWSFINPLLLLLIYSFVFTTILKNTTTGIQPYALFMFCGILPWTWFASSLTEAAGSLIAGGNLIKKVLFPAEVLPIVSVLTNMVHFFLGLPILV